MRIFSKFTYRLQCDDARDKRHGQEFEEYIEPLAGVLRDPRGPCPGPGLAHNDIGSLDFVLLPQARKPLSKAASVTIFDFGASLWDSGYGRASQQWFHDNYNLEKGFEVTREIW